jgi:hypothetical protein
MKILPKIKILSIILIFVTISFTLLGSYNMFEFKNVEGYHDSSGVPTCNNSLEDEDDEISQNWFLKSSLVPPVCTSCPYYNNSADLRSNNSSNKDVSNNQGSNQGSNSLKDSQNISGSIISGNKGDDNSVRNNVEQTTTSTSDYYNKQMKVDIEKNQNDNSVRQDNSNKQNINTDNSVNQDLSQSETAESKFNNLFGNNSIMFGSFGGGGSGSNTINAQNKKENSDIGRGGLLEGGLLPVSTPALVNSNSNMPYQNNVESTTLINNLKSTITKLNQQLSQNTKGECPACPACERCPEPSFECKKVPNYRSPQIDNYMPVPILNDFSNF